MQIMFISNLYNYKNINLYIPSMHEYFLVGDQENGKKSIYIFINYAGL